MSDFDKLLEETVSSEEVFDGVLLHVFKDEARLPDGSTSTREYIRHPGASAVLPVFETGEVMMVEQFRYPLKQTFLEVPAGKIDPGETPESTARREIREEAGLEFGSIHYLGPFHPSIGYTDEVIHLYVAWDLTTYEQASDPDEFLIRKKVPFKKVVSRIHAGEITDGKTMVNVLRAWEWWQQEGPFKVS